MKIVFFGNGNRGTSCLNKLVEKDYLIELVVGHPKSDVAWYSSVVELARKLSIKTIEPESPNSPEVEQLLKRYNPDLFILAGYGEILKQNIIDIPCKMCINLHAGKLPKYRGSSPLNWALINGEQSFTLSIIKVDPGVDTGKIIIEKSFPITKNDTIRELHAIANEQFPLMLLDVLKEIENNTYEFVSQDHSQGSYYPLRFPEDGLILWDMYTAEQVHNRIRALTEPYPCAFTFFKSKKIKLLESELCDYNNFGESGRLYQKTNGKLLICAQDKCLWIKKAVFETDGVSIYDYVKRYEKLATLKEVAISFYLNNK